MIEFLEYEFANNNVFAIYIYILVVLLGLIFGSFLNVVALRFLSGESIVFPSSKCPKCQTPLKWYDNIPVIAYILLLGKCRYCKKEISLQYPIVEALTGIMYLLVFMKFGFSFATLMLFILVCCSIVMCITDFKEQIVFDIISIPLIPIGLIFSFFNLSQKNAETIQIFNTGLTINETFISALIGVVVAYLFFEIISLISKLLIKQRAFGEGDTIIAMGFAAWLGWKALIPIIILSFLTQAIATLPLMIFKLFKNKDKLAIFSFCGMIFSVLIPLILNQFNFFYTKTGSILLVITTLSIASISAISFIKRIKETQSMTFLPFGPALIVAGFVVLFFEKQLLSFIGF